MCVNTLCPLVPLCSSETLTGQKALKTIGHKQRVMDLSLLSPFILCSTNALSAIYETLEELLTFDFNFIIIRGLYYSSSSQDILSLTPSTRQNSGKCPCKPFGRGPWYLCARPRSGWIISGTSLKPLDVNILYRTEDVLLSQLPFFCPQVTPNTPLDWNFTTTKQPGLNGHSITYPWGYGLEGSSAVSTSLYTFVQNTWLLMCMSDYMLYTCGSSQDYDCYAQISGDPGWGWEALQPYFLKISDAFCLSWLHFNLTPQQNERFITPANHHNAYGEFDPVVHGFNGINSVSLSGYPCGTDGHIIQVTKELPSEFPFNLDYNSGYHLSIGKFSFQMAVLLNVLIIENTHRLDTIYYWKQNLQQLSDILSWAQVCWPTKSTCPDSHLCDPNSSIRYHKHQCIANVQFCQVYSGQWR